MARGNRWHSCAHTQHRMNASASALPSLRIQIHTLVHHHLCHPPILVSESGRQVGLRPKRLHGCALCVTARSTRRETDKYDALATGDSIYPPVSTGIRFRGGSGSRESLPVGKGEKVPLAQAPRTLRTPIKNVNGSGACGGTRYEGCGPRYSTLTEKDPDDKERSLVIELERTEARQVQHRADGSVHPRFRSLA